MIFRPSRIKAGYPFGRGRRCGEYCSHFGPPRQTSTILVFLALRAQPAPFSVVSGGLGDARYIEGRWLCGEVQRALLSAVVSVCCCLLALLAGACRCVFLPGVSCGRLLLLGPFSRGFSRCSRNFSEFSISLSASLKVFSCFLVVFLFFFFGVPPGFRRVVLSSLLSFFNFPRAFGFSPWFLAFSRGFLEFSPGTLGLARGSPTSLGVFSASVEVFSGFLRVPRVFLRFFRSPSRLCCGFLGFPEAPWSSFQGFSRFLLLLRFSRAFPRFPRLLSELPPVFSRFSRLPSGFSQVFVGVSRVFLLLFRFLWRFPCGFLGFYRGFLEFYLGFLELSPAFFGRSLGKFSSNGLEFFSGHLEVFLSFLWLFSGFSRLLVVSPSGYLGSSYEVYLACVAGICS